MSATIASSESLSEKGSDPLRRGQKTNEIDSPPKGQTPFRIGSFVITAFTLTVFVVADTASAQGPLRRLGDRIRERGGGPVAPGINEPAAAPSPLGRRPLLNGPLRSGPAAGPAAPDPVTPQPPAVGRAAAGASRSANYNRAAVASQRRADPAASRVEQSSAWESRQDLRGNASRETVPPVPRRPQSAQSLPTESISSAAPIRPPSSRARLGVVVDTPPVVTPEGLPPRQSRGALVSEVQPDSAAEVAGIVVGDLIVSVDGRVITSVRDLTQQLAGYEPGDEARFQINRDERLLTADVTLAGPDGIALRRPEPQAAERPAAGSPSIISGLGEAIGGLFGGSAEGTVRDSLPESLPPPKREKDED